MRQKKTLPSLEDVKKRIEQKQCSMCLHYREGLCTFRKHSGEYLAMPPFATCDEWKCEIVFGRDFTETPGGRYRSMHGKDGQSGEELREFLLRPAVETGRDVYVNLTGAFGMCASFASEAFEALIGSYPDAEREARMKQIHIGHDRRDSDYYDNVIGMMQDQVDAAKKRLQPIEDAKKQLDDALFDEGR